MGFAAFSYLIQDGLSRALQGLAIAGFAVVAQPQVGAADLLSSRPSEAAIRAATAACLPGRSTPPRNIVGISDPHTLDRRVIDLIAETGVRWVRAEFHWSQIQGGGTGGYDWAAYDRMVRAFSDRGIKVAAILTYIPRDLQDWGAIDAGFTAFAEAAVARYAPRGVHVWEVFNEPNLTGYGWLEKRDRPADYLGAYALLLARANAAVRRHDPQGVVVIGGLAGAGHRPLSPEQTMQELYALGVKPCFDVMAYHPYGYQSRFAEARARVDAILAQHGDQAKPVWFNEYGWTDYREMSLQVNSSEHTNPMIATFAQRGAAEALFWFSARDYSGRRSAPTFGLADHEFNKRDSFETFRMIIEHIHGQ
ncbi:MAG: cellulase family glycosylhydrolase [Paracoccaceae bacterium]